MVLVLGLLSGCGTADPEMCTLVGGATGVIARIPRDVAAQAGRLEVRVCKGSDCVSGVEPVARIPNGQHERFVSVEVPGMLERFARDEVTVTADFRGVRGRLIAAHESSVVLKPYYPNGKKCDGDGYVTASVEFGPADRR
jgi:hypothetical protein